MSRRALVPIALLAGLAWSACSSVRGDDDDDDDDGRDASIDDATPDAQVDPEVPPEIDGRITINELMAANVLTAADEADRAGDWVELYNPTDRDIPLYGYGFTDDLAMVNRSRIPAGPVLPAGGHLVFWLDGAPDRGPRHAGFQLAREGGDLALVRPDGSFIDRVRYGAQQVDFSAAREPDGSDGWVIEWHASPGQANPEGAGQPVGAEDPEAPPEQVPAAGDLSEEILGYDVIPELELLVSDESATALRQQPLVYAPVSLRFRGRAYGPVGARLKGMDTFQPFDQKPSWRINIDEFVPGAKFFGLDDLTLNNMASDRSMMHERIAYRVARDAGVPASRANHAVVRVNGQLYGLYANVETVTKHMVGRWFGDNSGPLFESEGADFFAAEIAMFEHESGPDDRTLLAATAEALALTSPAQAIAAVATPVHMGQFYRFWGMCAVVGQFDSFPVYDDDYFLYADPQASKLWFMPWGMDEAFTSSGYDPTNVNSLLGKTCKAVPSCLQAVADRAWEILAMTEAMDILGEHARVKAQIAPWVAMDQRKPYTAAEVTAGQDSMRYFLLERRNRLTQVLPPPSQ